MKYMDELYNTTHPHILTFEMFNLNSFKRELRADEENRICNVQNLFLICSGSESRHGSALPLTKHIFK